MYGGGRRSGGGVATGCRTTARATAATTTAPLQPPSRRLAQPAAGGNGQSPAAGAVLTVRRQAKDALAELERRRASTPVGGISRAARGSSNSREPAAAGEGQVSLGKRADRWRARARALTSKGRHLLGGCM